MEENEFFFGIPQSEVDANLIVLGLPWFKSSSYRICNPNGPKAIREATSSKIYNPYTEDLINLVEKYKIRDLGDLNQLNVNFVEYGKKVLNRLREVSKGNVKFLFIGGDHSVSILIVKALKELNGEFGLIYFDAHPDLYPVYNGDIYSHACTLRRIIDEGYVQPKNISLIGVRAPTLKQIEFLKEKKLKFFTTKDINETDLKSVINEIKDTLENVNKLYISIDLDVLDPAYAPGVGNPEPGGLSTRTLIGILHGFKDFEIIGFDVVEYCLDFDCTSITAYTSAKIIRETLGVASYNL